MLLCCVTLGGERRLSQRPLEVDSVIEACHSVTRSVYGTDCSFSCFVFLPVYITVFWIGLQIQKHVFFCSMKVWDWKDTRPLLIKWFLILCIAVFENHRKDAQFMFRGDIIKTRLPLKMCRKTTYKWHVVDLEAINTTGIIISFNFMLFPRPPHIANLRLST